MPSEEGFPFCVSSAGQRLNVSKRHAGNIGFIPEHHSKAHSPSINTLGGIGPR